MKKYRAESLDALRGFAIFMMVLSGSICAEVLPAWMSHAQVPPGQGFVPTVPGITWVDLVFPFFLFSMGAAFPFSTGSRLERGANRIRMCLNALWRGAKLAFFAIFIANVNPWALSHAAETPQTPFMWIMTLLAFVLLFPMFLRLPGKPSRVIRMSVQFGGIIAGIAQMWLLSLYYDKPFDIFRSNIIILVLANMAVFGTVIYILTFKKPLARIAVLPPLMAILLCSDADGSWQQEVFNWSPAPWLYRFMFLKYLFIIIPGTIAGEYLRKWIKGNPDLAISPSTRRNLPTATVLIIAVALLVVNLVCLFGRHLVLNLFISSILVIASVIVARRLPDDRNVIFSLVKAGGYILITGLFFEAFQGAIRKDPSTFSYYFVTAGLAFHCLAAFVIICDIYKWHRAAAPLTMSGKNPMIAYVATSMFTMPILNLCHIGDFYTIGIFTQSPLLGFIHGFVLTSIACLIAMFFTRIKWFWRT